MSLTPERQAQIIGEFSALVEEILEAEGQGAEGLNLALALFGKAMLASVPNEREALQSIVDILNSPENQAAADKLRRGDI